MAWFTEQIFADFMNQNNNHVGATKALLSIMEDDVFLKFGQTEYRGRDSVFQFLEDTHNAISSDQGFTAKPVITKDAEGNQRKAVALFSKLEDYVSWLFRIRGSVETWKIVHIEAERPNGYTLYYDLYNESDYDDEGNAIPVEIESDEDD